MFYRFIISSLIIAQSLHATEDSIRTRRINVHAGFILSRSFSNYPLRSSVDEQSTTKYSAIDTGQKYKPGFYLGTDLLLLPGENFKILLGISYSQTSASYHSSYISVGPTSKSGFTELKRVTENDYQFSFSALNFQAGIRNHLQGNWFLTSSFLLTSPLRIVRVLDGFTETTYSNNSGASDRDVIYIKNEKTVLTQKAADLSFRLNIEYQIRIGSAPAAFHFFRNFGLLYALPWWGLGFSYCINH
jgi:hypothetical protein